MLIFEENESDEDDTERYTNYPETVKAWLDNEVILQFSVAIKDGFRKNSVNRQSSVNLDLIKDEWYHFRMSAVAITDFRNIIHFSPMEACEVHAVGYDGV
jgi:hypothetical protein